MKIIIEVEPNYQLWGCSEGASDEETMNLFLEDPIPFIIGATWSVERCV